MIEPVLVDAEQKVELRILQGMYHIDVSVKSVESVLTIT